MVAETRFSSADEVIAAFVGGIERDELNLALRTLPGIGMYEGFYKRIFEAAERFGVTRETLQDIYVNKFSGEIRGRIDEGKPFLIGMCLSEFLDSITEISGSLPGGILQEYFELSIEPLLNNFPGQTYALDEVLKLMKHFDPLLSEEQRQRFDETAVPEAKRKIDYYLHDISHDNITPQIKFLEGKGLLEDSLREQISTSSINKLAMRNNSRLALHMLNHLGWKDHAEDVYGAIVVSNLIPLAKPNVSPIFLDEFQQQVPLPDHLALLISDSMNNLYTSSSIFRREIGEQISELKKITDAVGDEARTEAKKSLESIVSNVMATPALDMLGDQKWPALVNLLTLYNKNYGVVAEAFDKESFAPILPEMKKCREELLPHHRSYMDSDERSQRLNKLAESFAAFEKFFNMPDLLSQEIRDVVVGVITSRDFKSWEYISDLAIQYQKMHETTANELFDSYVGNSLRIGFTRTMQQVKRAFIPRYRGYSLSDTINSKLSGGYQAFFGQRPSFEEPPSRQQQRPPSRQPQREGYQSRVKQQAPPTDEKQIILYLGGKNIGDVVTSLLRIQDSLKDEVPALRPTQGNVPIGDKSVYFDGLSFSPKDYAAVVKQPTVQRSVQAIELRGYRNLYLLDGILEQSGLTVAHEGDSTFAYAKGAFALHQLNKIGQVLSNETPKQRNTAPQSQFRPYR